MEVRRCRGGHYLTETVKDAIWEERAAGSTTEQPPATAGTRKARGHRAANSLLGSGLIPRTRVTRQSVPRPLIRERAGRSRLCAEPGRFFAAMVDPARPIEHARADTSRTPPAAARVRSSRSRPTARNQG